MLIRRPSDGNEVGMADDLSFRELSAEEVWSPDGDRILRLSGDLDLNTSRQLRELLATAIDGGAPRVVVDLSAVDFIDSTGLGDLVSALKRARRKDRELILRSPRTNAQKLFEITGLHRIFEIER